MAVTLVEDPEPVVVAITTEWPQNEGMLETVMEHLVGAVAPPYDKLDGAEIAQICIDATIRLTEPAKALLVRAMQDNWTLTRFEKELGILAADYSNSPDLSS